MVWGDKFITKIVAVLCAKDEDMTYKKVVSRTMPFVDKLIFVDDGSKKPVVLNDFGDKVVLLRNEINKGKGFSMRRGAREALDLGADILVFQDVDAQHNPAYIPVMLSFLVERKVDVVKGARYFDEMPLLKMVGNLGLSVIFTCLFFYKTLDSQCGFKMYSREGLKSLLDCECNGYEVEVEQLLNVKKHKLRMFELPIRVTYLTPETRPGGGLKIGWWLLKRRCGL